MLSRMRRARQPLGSQLRLRQRSISFDVGPSAFLSGPLHAIRFLAHRTPVQNDALMGASNRNDWSRQLCAIHEATQAAKKQVPMRR
jgi:hypothetical protein